MLLVTTSNNRCVQLRAHAGEGHVGRLLQPRMATSVDRTIELGLPWAADNDAFSGFRPGPYLKMLGSIAEKQGCLFVVAPDVVADARATLTRFMRYGPIIHECGLPAAYVLQDGLEGVGVPWDKCEAIFIGGTTEFKLSPLVHRTVREAKNRGKWVHMGRVNSKRRIRYAASIGCDSVDGSRYGRFYNEADGDLHALPFSQGHLEEPGDEDADETALVSPRVDTVGGW